MARYFKIAALIIVIALVSISLLGWWYLRFDVIEAPELPGEIEAGVVRHEGKQRGWFAYLPASRGSSPPVVLVLHGSQGKGNDIRGMSFYGFDVEAERAGFIAVYPDGYEGHWNDCRASASYAANQENIDDVGFFRALVEELQGRYGIDPQRVYAAGFSNGGHMAYRLALEAPELVRGVAAISANLPVAANLGCAESGQPVSVLMINGTADPVNPYAGGLVEILGDASRGEVRSALDTADYWAQLAGYSGEGEARSLPDQVADDDTSVETLRWADGLRPSVELVTVVGGGHTMPNPSFNLPLLLGPTSHEFDSAQLIWEFFSALPLVEPRRGN